MRAARTPGFVLTVSLSRTCSTMFNTGAIDRPIPAIAAFTVINACAAHTAATGRMLSDGSD